jgi:hypothetical protein
LGVVLGGLGLARCAREERVERREERVERREERRQE